MSPKYSPICWLATALVLFPSFSLIQRMGARLLTYLGVSLDNAYSASLLLLTVFVGFITLFLLRLPGLVECITPRLSDRHATALLLSAISMLLLLFLWLYPIATSGVFGGGSDRDEGLNIAVNALLNGDYPYYKVTYVPGIPHELGLDGNPISPMPGELLLSMPFVALFGNAAYQTFFWLGLTAFALQRLVKSQQVSVVLIFAMMCLLPNLLHESITGGDLLVNSLWVFIAFVGLLQAKSTSARIGFVILMGLALSSRLNFLLVTPFIAGLLYQQHGFKVATTNCAAIALVYVGVTAPFYLYDPAGFSPLHAYSKLGRFDPIIPYAGLLVPIVSGLMGLVFMIKLQGRQLGVWLIACAAVMAVPVVFGTLMQSWQESRLNFLDFSWYGISWVIFAYTGFYLEASRYLKGASISS